MDFSKTSQLRTDAIFVIRQMQERYKEKKKMYHVFVDLEKAFVKGSKR